MVRELGTLSAFDDGAEVRTMRQIEYLEEPHEIVDKPLAWQKLGLQQTASGYGAKQGTMNRARDAWNTAPPLQWGRCWFQTHESTHGPSVNAPCAREWTRQAESAGGTVEWIDGYCVAFRVARD